MRAQASCLQSPAAFVVGSHGTKPVIPELRRRSTSQQTGGRLPGGPCLTQGFFASVSPAGTIIEAPTGAGVHTSRSAPMACWAITRNWPVPATRFQPVLATHWIRGENGATTPALIPPVAELRARDASFPQTGHNVSGPFPRQVSGSLGGANVLGYPITEVSGCGALASPISTSST